MKLILSSVVLLLTVGLVALSAGYQIYAADAFTELLDNCIKDVDKKDMEAFTAHFGEFTALYEKKRSLLALFMHSDRVEELDSVTAGINAILENGDSLADDSGYDRIAAELSALIDTAERIKESNSLSPSNILYVKSRLFRLRW